MNAGMTTVKPRNAIIEGVYIQVLVDNKYVKWNEMGHIPELATGKNISLIINTKPNIWAFKVEEEKNIKQLQNFSQSGNKIYRQEITIRRRGKSPYTLDTENDTRLLRINDFCFDIHEIAIVFPGGQGFLRTRRAYEDFCFQNDGKVCCPRFEKWPQLIDFLNKIHKENGTFDRLPCVSEDKSIAEEILCKIVEL